jgi:hypothetical protein
MATNPSVERARLFAIILSEAPTDVPVFVETSGEIQIVASGPAAGDRRIVPLKAGRRYNLLDFAPIEWWQVQASLNELANAIAESWLSVPTDAEAGGGAPAQTPAPDEQVHEIILWRSTAPPQNAPNNQARMHFNGSVLRLSQNGGDYVVVAPPATVQTNPYAATLNLDMDPSLPVYRTVTLAGNIAFTGSNYGPGRQVSLRIVADGSLRTLAFPSGWKFLGAAAPADIAANKTAVLSFVGYGAGESDVVVAYSVEP